MNPDSFLELLMGRGLRSDLAQVVVSRFPDWETLCRSERARLAEQFSEEELESIERAKARREIPRATVKRLIDESEFRCCLCWNIDADPGVVIHHIRLHATVPDDRYENLIILCVDHHDKVHTRRELTRHPYPPELLLRRKEDFAAAIRAFKAGERPAPGREKATDPGHLVGPPHSSPHFIGRDVLLRDIAKALAADTRRVAIVGMGGVGKTALALKSSISCRTVFPGGVLWAQVATESKGVDEVLRLWIRSLGRDASGMEFDEQLALFGSLLTTRVASKGRLLLMVDDVREDMANELVRLASYIPPGVSILITTRETTVAAALGACQFLVDPLQRADSLRLLESVSGSYLIRAEASNADHLLSLLGDLPLAIELVARQIAIRERKPEFTIGALCRRLESFDPEILSFPGHRGVAMSFALSYENLAENEQRVFRSFGLFASGPLFTASVAVVVAVSEDEMEEVLDRLAVVSMLNWGVGKSEYRLHPLLHKYADFLFDRANIAEQISARRQFYLHYIAAARAVVKNDSHDRVAIDGIFSNLDKAIHFAAAAEDHFAVLQIVLGLCAEMGYFTSRNRERESMPLLRLAIAAAKSLGDEDGEAACTAHLGTAFARLGLMQEAVVRYERAIAISRKSGNHHDLASHLQNLGTTLLSEAKDLPRAERLLHEAFKFAELSRNSDVVIACLSTLGTLQREIGNLDEARRLYAGALEAARLAGDRQSEGNNLSNLGLVTDQLGNSADGEQMVRDALVIAAEIGDHRGEGNRNGHLGGMLFKKATRLPSGPERSHTLDNARELISTALRFAQETGDVEREGIWEMNLGNISVFGGHDADGVHQYEKALTIAETRGFARLEAQARFNLGLVLVPMGKAEVALNHFKISHALLRKMHSPMAVQVETYINRLNSMLSKRNVE